MSNPPRSGAKGELVSKARGNPFSWGSVNDWAPEDELVAFFPVTLGGISSHYPHVRPILMSSEDVLRWAELQSAPGVEPSLAHRRNVIDYEVEFDEQLPPLPEELEVLPPPNRPENEEPRPPKESGNTTMSQPSREEIDAKLQAVEARMDARVAEVTGKIDTLMNKLDARETLYQTQFGHINEKLNSLSGLRMVVITTVLGTGIGIVGLVFAMMTGMGSSFDSGRETAQLTAAAEKSASAAETALSAINLTISAAIATKEPAPTLEQPKAEQPDRPADAKKP